MDETLTLADTSTRSFVRGMLLSLWERETLLTTLTLGRGAETVVEQKCWQEYWEPVFKSGSSRLRKSVDDLHSSWRSYIRSGFDDGLVRKYCLDYFSLLDAAAAYAEQRNPPASWRDVLRSVLTFECFGIRDVTGAANGRILAAGTSTQRNPCYLLVKLKQPRAIDDCQFLPLITGHENNSHSLFYHYRQHRLSSNSGNSALLYLCADQKRRQESFHAVNALEHQIGQGSDPWAAERANRITQNVVLPYLKALRTVSDVPVPNQSTFELVDLGAGSGLLGAEICKRTAKYLLDQDSRVRIRVWMIDLSLSEPGRFFMNGPLSQLTDHLSAVGVDYQDWFATRRRLPKTRGIRIGLISRFFNNLSDFGITPISVRDFIETTETELTISEWKNCLPTSCLPETQQGPNALCVSNTRVWLPGGRSFVLASLSPYFAGLHRLVSADTSPSGNGGDSETIFLPLRSFRRTRLLASDGRSVLERMLEDCRMVVVQDSDLRPEDVLAHRNTIESGDTVAIDMTKALGLRGHFSYVLLRESDPALKTLKGDRLW